MKKNRFRKHPVLSALLVVFLLAILIELCLRMVDPDILDFAYHFRQVYQYHDRWYTNFNPGASSTIRLKDSTGSYFFNFIVTVNEFGFRTYDRKLDYTLKGNKKEKIIHAIGDSFTMGWGVNYEVSYPALLEFYLPCNYRVLNLGLNGFGTIAATEKSEEVSQYFMPDAVVYLATENDYDDDDKASVHSRKSHVIHALYDALNFLRQHTYIASTPFALYWWLYYKELIKVEPSDFPEKKTFHKFVSDNFKVLDLKTKQIKSKGKHSKLALSKYSSFLKKKGILFIVISHGQGPVSRDIHAFCKENGIDSYLVSIPKSLRLNKEGHFNYLGNYKFAILVRNILREKGFIQNDMPKGEAVK